jgi:hypothetical protein
MSPPGRAPQLGSPASGWQKTVLLHQMGTVHTTYTQNVASCVAVMVQRRRQEHQATRKHAGC